MEFTRINNDVNGNPRYVCHFLAFITEEDRATVKGKFTETISNLYDLALKRAKKLGGRKYHTKGYGGGIVFKSYNVGDLERRIRELVSTEYAKSK